MIQIRIDVLSIIYLGCTMLYMGHFQNGRLQKDDKLDNYVPAIESFYTYNFLVCYGE